jgi:hypothetical protein
MTDDRRIIGEASNYDEVIEVFRQRLVELKLTRECLDSVTGLPSGYCAKLCSIPPVKCFGRKSLGFVLAGTAMKILFVEDTEALARFSKQFTESTKPELADAKIDVVNFQISRRKLSVIGRRGGNNRAEKLSAKRRARIAQKAGKASGRKRRRRLRRRGRPYARKLSALSANRAKGIIGIHGDANVRNE